MTCITQISENKMVEYFIRGRKQPLSNHVNTLSSSLFYMVSELIPIAVGI